VSGETQSTQSASEAAKRMCSEQKQQLEEQKQRLEEQKQRLVEHKQGLRSRISQLNERVKQLEADLESEKRRASDQRFTSQRLIRQLDQKQRLQQQALERAAQCPDKQNNQSSPQSRSLPTTSQASALRSDVMAFQQKDREVLPVGSRIRRTDGRVDDTKANETGLAASQWLSRTGWTVHIPGKHSGTLRPRRDNRGTACRVSYGESSGTGCGRNSAWSITVSTVG